ncbi:MAG: ATP synthase F1 subunit gamma [Muribaculaceae bacterium]|jgi:F-type H+-transporting ATPase subunit gamma|nr:ATP synthase F1 subunit gamma [Muribaculaceae bacterium]MBQ5722854.1 ATP synthase F1 subunit gamma [Muribaculaceae bacterium]MEE1365396.1 ATP synthase F1 subunit gamma [Muribaculaceae bacterium]
MSTLRELKTRIGSVSSSEKITGAMKMISSAKVHKSERDLRRLLPFKNQIKSIMGHLLAADGDYTSPLTEEREVSKVGIVVFGSDDGLCGAYNVNIFKQMLVIMNNYREQYGDSTSFTVFPVGKKMLKAVKKIDGGFISVKSVKGVDSKMTGDKVTEFTEELKHAFISGELDKVIVVYMNFKSISRQILTEEQLFPVEASALGGELDAKSANKLYIFEPDGNRIFNEVLPMFVLSTMQEITIENRASEQAARIMAMQSANDNAKKLLESLRLEYNKLRQQSITTELLDILGGQVEK